MSLIGTPYNGFFISLIWAGTLKIRPLFKKNKGHLEPSGIFCMYIYIYNIVKPTIMLMSLSLKEKDGSWSTQAHVRGGVHCRESRWRSPLPKAASFVRVQVQFFGNLFKIHGYRKGPFLKGDTFSKASCLVSILIFGGVRDEKMRR